MHNTLNSSRPKASSFWRKFCICTSIFALQFQTIGSVWAQSITSTPRPPRASLGAQSTQNALFKPNIAATPVAPQASAGAMRAPAATGANAGTLQTIDLTISQTDSPLQLQSNSALTLQNTSVQAVTTTGNQFGGFKAIAETGDIVLIKTAQEWTKYKQETACITGQQATCFAEHQIFPRSVNSYDASAASMRVIRGVANQAALAELKCPGQRNVQGGCRSPVENKAPIATTYPFKAVTELGSLVDITSEQAWVNHLQSTACMPDEKQATCDPRMQLFPRTIATLKEYSQAEISAGAARNPYIRIVINRASELEPYKKYCSGETGRIKFSHPESSLNAQGACINKGLIAGRLPMSGQDYEKYLADLRLPQAKLSPKWAPPKTAGMTSRMPHSLINPEGLNYDISQWKFNVSTGELMTTGLQKETKTITNAHQAVSRTAETGLFNPSNLDQLGLPWDLHKFSLEAAMHAFNTLPENDQRNILNTPPTIDSRAVSASSARLEPAKDYYIWLDKGRRTISFFPTEKSLRMLDGLLGKRIDDLGRGLKRDIEFRGRTAPFLASKIISVARVDAASRTKSEQELLNYFSDYTYKRLSGSFSSAKAVYDNWVTQGISADMQSEAINEAIGIWNENSYRMDDMMSSPFMNLLRPKLGSIHMPLDWASLLAQAESGMDMYEGQQTSFQSGAVGAAAGMAAVMAVGVAAPAALFASALVVPSVTSLVLPFLAVAVVGTAEGSLAAGTTAVAAGVAGKIVTAASGPFAFVVIALASTFGSLVVGIINLVNQQDGGSMHAHRYFTNPEGPPIQWLDNLTGPRTPESNTAAQRVTTMTLRMATAY